MYVASGISDICRQPLGEREIFEDFERFSGKPPRSRVSDIFGGTCESNRDRVVRSRAGVHHERPRPP